MIVEEMAEGESFLRDYASDEVLLHIFSYMDPRTLGRCAQVCKRCAPACPDFVRLIEQMAYGYRGSAALDPSQPQGVVKVEGCAIDPRRN